MSECRFCHGKMCVACTDPEDLINRVLYPEIKALTAERDELKEHYDKCPLHGMAEILKKLHDGVGPCPDCRCVKHSEHAHTTACISCEIGFHERLMETDKLVALLRDVSPFIQAFSIRDPDGNKSRYEQAPSLLKRVAVAIAKHPEKP